MLQSNFLSKPPSLPAGASAAGGYSIKRCLQSDSRSELYILQEEPEFTTIGLYTFVEEPHEERNLQQFFRQQEEVYEGEGSNEIKILHVTNEHLSDQHALNTVARVKAGICSDRPSSLAEDPTMALIEFFNALIGFSRKALQAGLEADCSPPFIFLDHSSNRAQPVCVRLLPGFKPDAEQRAVRDAARTVYWLASGQDPLGESRATRVLLSKHDSRISAKMACLVASCLQASETAGAVTSFAELQCALAEITAGASNPAAGFRPASAGNTPRSGKGFAKLGGMTELKERLNEIIVSIIDPEEAREYGINIPNGILLFGPPGCGKTFLAEAIAEELNQRLPPNSKPWAFLKHSPGSVASIFVHGAVQKIGEIFDAAAASAPSILFIDEFDALAPKRAELGAWQQYKQDEVNELLIKLEACASKQVLVIAASNHPEKIDEAVQRSGRLDWKLYVPPPDAQARREILRLLLAQRRRVTVSEELTRFADELEGYSASDIKLLVETAAVAARKGRTNITVAHLSAATIDVPASLKEAVAAGDGRSQGNRSKQQAKQLSGFEKIAGLKAAKALIGRSIIDKVVAAAIDPEGFASYKLLPPRGLLLFGPPGCGKTYLARAIAEEINLRMAEKLGLSLERLPGTHRYRFEEVIPSDIASTYIHGGTERISRIFQRATRAAPCVLFIDEFEALVPVRAALGPGGYQKSEEVNEFLTQLDDCANRGILVLAATNLPTNIDPAIIRSGRFDVHIEIPMPDLASRIEILVSYLAGCPLAEELKDGSQEKTLQAVAERLNGATASDIRWLVQNATEQAYFSQSKLTADHLISSADSFRARRSQ